MKASPAGRMGELATEERPREKLFARGPEALSDDELLALLLGTGSKGRPVLETARQILGSAGFPALFSRGPSEMAFLERGVGKAKAARISAVLEIARRLSRRDLHARPLLGDPTSAAHHLMTMLAEETQEVMGGLFLDSKNGLIKDVIVFRGTSTHTAVAPSPLFRVGILAGAVGVILFHNHPSGDPQPSSDDVATTRRFVAAGREIGIEVRDHVIVGRGRYFSFVSSGLL